MNKTTLLLKKTTLIGILFFLTPIYASAEAGKSIKPENIIFALFVLVLIFVNQVYLTITSIKKIMKPEVNSSILHYISFVISIILLIIYFPNKGSHEMHFFELFIIIPFLLGVISFFIAIFNWLKKKS
jgi:hypothetical protein